MCTKEQIQEAKQYLSEQGYGTGSNFTVNAVANLMAEWLAKKCNIPYVIKSVCKYGMNPDDCIRKADTCFDCLKDS